MTRSPRRLKDQVRETVTELPVHAARFAVMGVGRALLLTDRVRKDYREARKSGLGPVLGRLKDEAESLTGRVVGRVAGRASGNGQAAGKKARRESEIAVGKPKTTATRPTPPRPPSRPAAAPKPASKPKPAPEKATGKPTEKPAAKPTEKPAEKPPAAKDLPITGYDEATIASVRARLRGLDARQVAQLRDYERAHAARAEFLRMYENRIAKLRGDR